MVPRRLSRLALFLMLALILGGCAVEAPVKSTMDVTEIQAFSREQLVALLEDQGILQYEILGSSLAFHGNQCLASYDLDIRGTDGKTVYQNAQMVIEFTDQGITGIQFTDQPTLPQAEAE
jgi:hypothetical protein